MRCRKCGERTVFSSPALCKDHFISAFEKKVYDTIDRYKLISRGQRIAVACSGGKDSTVLLHLLQKRGYDVTAMAIDEGIAGYRDKTLAFLRRFCFERGIPLQVHRYQDAFGASLDHMMQRSPRKPCTVCGVFRRYLLNRHARDFDLLALGHNLDDEAQSILMNLLLNNRAVLSRLGPKAGIVEAEGFTPRIKPLYLCREKEVMAYSFIQNLLTDFTECPNIVDSFRAEVRDFLNDHEASHPGFKELLVHEYLSSLPRLQRQAKDSGDLEPVGSCSLCREPSAAAVCRACSLKKEIRVSSPERQGA
ncbi:MAG: TIGR00269 family protein [DPANN group archaeon]|nr:TIGR00269 family protein [DPANN group archaeon]